MMNRKNKIILTVASLLLSLSLMAIGVFAALDAGRLIKISGTINLRLLVNPHIKSISSGIKIDADDYSELTPIDGIIENLDLDLNEETPSVIFRFDIEFSETTEIEISLDLGASADTGFSAGYAVGTSAYEDIDYVNSLFSVIIALDSVDAMESGENYTLSVHIMLTALDFDGTSAPFILYLA